MVFLPGPRGRRRGRVARVAVLLGALFVVGFGYSAAGVQSAGDPVGAAAPAATDLQIEEGRALFLSSCSSCHGLNLQGSSDGPSLIGVGAAAVHFQVSTGRMPAATSDKAQIVEKPTVFEEDEVLALAAYIAQFGAGAPIPSESELNLTGAEIAYGGELFRTNCAACHGFTGQGGALSRGKYGPEIDATARQTYEAMLTGPQSMPVFNDQILAPQDKRDIIAYLAAVQSRPSTGGYQGPIVGPVSEGVVAWAVGIIVLSAGAVWLGARAR